MSDRRITEVMVEYSELGQNLRATWKYISDLLKMWIAFQIGAIIFVLACMHFHQQYVSADSPFTKFFAALCIFSVLSAILSFGAAQQNTRLFGSAEAFVARADFLETSEEFTKGDDEPLSQYAFMRDELYQFDRTNLSKVLSLIYNATGFIWAIFVAIYFGILLVILLVKYL